MKSPFLNSVRDSIRAKHYSIKTEHTYLYWIYWYIRFNGMEHPRNCNEKDIRRYLDYLALACIIHKATVKIEENAS